MKTYSAIGFKAGIAVQIILASCIILLLGNNKPWHIILAITAISISLCYLYINCREKKNSLFDSEQIFAELGLSLKRGTSQDPDRGSPATDVEIDIIMNQLEDAEYSDEAQTKEFLGKAHELINSYRPWYKRGFFI